MKKYLLVFLISMIPIVELRGAIPIAAAKGLPFGWTYALTVLGNMLPVPFILLLIPVLFAFMRRHHILVGLVDWLERKAEKGAKKMEKRAGKAATAETETADAPAAVTEEATEEPDAPKKGKKAAGALAFLGLYLFVAIPLPGTGAWTGSLVAAVFGMKKWRALFAVFLGVLTAGVIMTLASYGVVSAFKIFTK
ncbi:MAG: small multi-drug export protein [Clostridia bacterium]|nr:small multi-drug export protein [Clostridia bacterium]